MYSLGVLNYNYIPGVSRKVWRPLGPFSLKWIILIFGLSISVVQGKSKLFFSDVELHVD